jgi:hypothetical protein
MGRQLQLHIGTTVVDLLYSGYALWIEQILKVIPRGAERAIRCDAVVACGVAQVASRETGGWCVLTISDLEIIDSRQEDELGRIQSWTGTACAHILLSISTVR